MVGTTYAADATYGSGTAVGDGYVVYAGSGSTFDVAGLTAGNTYHFDVYEYNGTNCYYLAGKYQGSYLFGGSDFTVSANTVADGQLCRGATDIAVQSFIGVVAGGDGYITDIDFTTAGSGYINSDIDNYEFWYSATNDLSGATKIGTLAGVVDAAASTSTVIQK